MKPPVLNLIDLAQSKYLFHIQQIRSFLNVSKSRHPSFGDTLQVLQSKIKSHPECIPYNFAKLEQPEIIDFVVRLYYYYLTSVIIG